MRRRLTRGLACAVVLAAPTLACSSNAGPTLLQRQQIVYGADARSDYYEAGGAARSLMEGAMVALVPNEALEGGVDGLTAAPTYGEEHDLCSDERFAEQPAPAFCSGVLVDWDLVLTAGHCLRAWALDDFRVVFDYYYRSEGRLAVTEDSVRRPVEIVSERLDPQGSDPRIEYGWLRLDRVVSPPRQPALVYRELPALGAGVELLSIGAAGGTPLKASADGRVAHARLEQGDWFAASTDTSAGDSGGGAFDGEGALLGNLSRGGEDFVITRDGCWATAKLPENAPAEEQYTYAHRALEGLCAKSTSSICRADCEEPCQALPLAHQSEDASCALASTATLSWYPRSNVMLWVALLLFVTVRRRAADSGSGERHHFRLDCPRCRWATARRWRAPTR